jgi:hypothetical protein
VSLKFDSASEQHVFTVPVQYVHTRKSKKQSKKSAKAKARKRDDRRNGATNDEYLIVIIIIHPAASTTPRLNVRVPLILCFAMAEQQDWRLGRRRRRSVAAAPRAAGCFATTIAVLLVAAQLTNYSFHHWENLNLRRDYQEADHRRLEADMSKSSKMKILYTMTSLAEYNTGSRKTTKGSDRLQESLIPVLSEGVHSMLSSGYEVDVFLVCGFTLQPERLELVRKSLPQGVGLKYWDDAIPVGYDSGYYKEGDGTSRVQDRTVSLARQHRFVVKDHFLDYDLFVNFEDDMLIKGDQVQHFVKVTDEIQRLKELAPDDLPGNRNRDAYSNSFHGPMTKGQLSRMIPGFIRVEVLLDKATAGSTQQPPIPIEPQDRSQIDPEPCCHVSDERSSPKRPSNPEKSQVILWETGILALGVRKMQSSFLDWVTLLRGPKSKGDVLPNTVIGDYWSGKGGYFGKEKRPGFDSRKYINNQGGWMATRQQIWDWHTRICPGGFLPPYEAPHYRFDGLDLRDVEWWSGGLHLSTFRHACNMHRIVTLDQFDKHLIYHTANNKQTQLGLHRFTKADDLLGQLKTVQKSAAQAIEKGAL